jgi:uncharacterized membrane protein YphA (DoxX/SURF4 family)
MPLELLRIGIGLIWLVNLGFILDPSNDFFPTFQGTAQSFQATTITGPSISQVVADYPLPFALAIAFVTFYLALSFLTGIGTRIGCIVGAVFSVVLLITQWGSTFVVPGGTDVGPHPLYLLLYGALYFGGAGRFLTLRTWLSTGSKALDGNLHDENAGMIRAEPRTPSGTAYSTLTVSSTRRTPADRNSRDSV